MGSCVRPAIKTAAVLTALALVGLTVGCEQSEDPVAAIQSAVATPAGSPLPAAVDAAARLACASVREAVSARDAADWAATLTALRQAARQASLSVSPDFRSWTEPGAVDLDDTQTLNELADLRAAACARVISQ